jgi:hypothetical protein
VITDSAAVQPPDDLGLASRNSNQELPVSVDAYPCFRVVGSTQHAVPHCNCGTGVTFRTRRARPTSLISLTKDRSFLHAVGPLVLARAHELTRHDVPALGSRTQRLTALSDSSDGVSTMSGVV